MAEKSKTENREINSIRIFNAPRELVWRMWSDPQHLANWWGPKGFKNTFHKFEFKAGSEWSLTMHGPDGTDYENVFTIVEIEKPNRIVMDHLSRPLFRIIATFEEVSKNRTRVHFQQIFETPEIAGAIKNFAVIGNEENFNRMDVELSKVSGATHAREFVLTRSFKAPVELMWKMWTDPVHMQKWWGPKEVSVGHTDMDFRRGGTYHYCMVTPDKKEMWGKFYILDIVKEKRFMFINTFSDREGNITRHPMSPTWPLETLSTITFEAKGDSTEVTICWYPINATEEEVKTFNEGHEGMKMGWGGSLDRLASVV